MKMRSTGGCLVSVLLAALAATGWSATAHAQEWRFAVGTGIFAMNAKGDEGFGTTALGPVAVDLDLKSSDVADMLDSALGLAGFATNGTWTIYYSGAKLKLKDTSDGTTAAGTPVSGKFEFEVTTGELAAGYQFAHTGNNFWGVLGGVNYTHHKYDVGVSSGTASFTHEVDNDWIDAIIGVTHRMEISDTLAWSNRVDVSFGESDGAVHARTSLLWALGAHKNWLTSFYLDFKAVDFENAHPGDLNWYKYDVNEFGPGVGVSYVF